MKRLARVSFRLVYPHYFDSKRSRAEGRRVSRQLASAMPTQKQLVSILNNLGLNCQIQDGKAYSKDPATKSFRIVVFTDMKKSELLKNISMRLRSQAY